MTIPVILDHCERQTIIAALRYWRDEMTPFPDAQRHYLDDPQHPTMNTEEIDSLCRKLTSIGN